MKSNVASIQKAVGAYSFSSSAQFITLKMMQPMSRALIEMFRHEIQQYLPKKLDMIVNFEGRSTITSEELEILSKYSKSLKAFGKSIRIISAAPAIVTAIKTQNLSQVLPVSTSIRSALTDLGVEVQTRTLDANFINPFLNAAINVLQIQTNTTVTPGAPFKAETQDPIQGDISGIIGLVSDQFNGSVVISFPEETFLAIMSRMLGEEYKELTKDLQDGAAELTNIIFGQAKIALNELGFQIGTALPTVVTGQNHQIQQGSMGPRIVIPFESDVGTFYIEVSLSS